MIESNDNELDFAAGVDVNVFFNTVLIHAKVICKYDAINKKLVFYSCCEEKDLFNVICPCEGTTFEESLLNLVQEIGESNEFKTYQHKH